MAVNETLSTPTRRNLDGFPSSPDSRFSSPNIYGLGSWTPGQHGGSSLWQVGLSSDNSDASSPLNRLSQFPNTSCLELTPNDLSDPNGLKGDNCKRGRPRADVISHLILEGSSSPSGIKCKVCNRVFPREKSLQAHLRTHTGERPYICDYPGCSRAFTQSGQLKTHQRLHAGEKPFVCSSPGCTNRYTHANRTCPLHPYSKPQRSAELVLQPSLAAGEDPSQVSRWLENYRRERVEKTPAKAGTTCTIASPLLSEPESESPPLPPTPPMRQSAVTESANARFVSQIIDSLMPGKRSKTKRGLASELEQENLTSHLHSPPKMSHPSLLVEKLTQPSSPAFVQNHILLSRSPSKVAHHQLSDLSQVMIRRPALVDISSAGNASEPASPLSLSPKRRVGSTRTPPASPIKTLNIKKRWLKESVQEENRQTVIVASPNKPGNSKQSNTSAGEEEHDSENLALPIRWSDSENDAALVAAARFRRSPLAWSAISALMEMSERDSSVNNQPLNLSTSKTSN